MTLLALAGCSSPDGGSQASPTITTTAAQATTAASKPGSRIFGLSDNQTAALDYLTTLEDRHAPFVSDDRLLALHRGGEICVDLDNGMSFSDLVASWKPELREDGAKLYVRAAVEKLCQDNRSKVPA
ncbi:DUF732 domain-containing protein [Nocardia sp. NPDC056611]|uniref:DUF732 domain-containing protein n=1 Tax=Nocardia sp. NPDC056611 TaxID=3345877 RepID=UPI00366AE158